MRRTLAALMVTGAAAATLAVAAGSATAAHCTDSGGPGNSDFTSHVQGASGPGGHNEGDHRGWSSCNPNSPNFVAP